jgi:Ca2+-binding EF-hand superfamily protein
MLKKAKKVKSTESTQSVVITGPAARQDLTIGSTASSMESSVGSGFGNSFVEGIDPVSDVYNCASIILHCQKHDLYAMTEVKSKAKKTKGLTMPTTYVTPKMGFRSSVNSKLKSMLANDQSDTGHIKYETPLMLQKISIQLPAAQKYVSRLIFKTSIPKKATLCCQNVDNKGIKWLSYQQLSSMQDQVWGPEAEILIKFMRTQKGLPNLLLEIPIKQAAPHLPREVPNSDAERLLKAAGFTERDVKRLLSEFIQHAFPERLMSQQALISYLRASKWAAKDTKMDEAGIFRAFASKKQHYICFDEFLLGLAASDPELNHQDAARSREDCIIRLYDSNGDGLVEKNELRKLVEESFEASGEKANEDMIQDSVEKLFSANGSKLREALSKNLIPGSAKLFRGQRSFSRCGDTTDPIAYDPIDPSFDPKSGKQRDTDEQKCDKCLEVKYMIGPFKIKLTRKERDGSGGRITSPEAIACQDNEGMDPARRDTVKRNTEKDGLERTILQSMPSCEWLKSPDAAEKIIELCERVLPIVKSEASLIELSTPCYVFGAAVGSANHLNEISQIMFPRLPMYELGSFLFLGNFMSGIETKTLPSLLFMLAHKSLCPQRFLILRGFCETNRRNDLQAQVRKFITNEAACHKVCEQLFNVLDQLPIAAVINNDLLCVSSGIPHSAERLSDIGDADAADSVKNKIADEIISLNLIKDAEIETILSKLSVSHVIRSGEKEFSDRGYSYRLNGLVITLSASGHKKAFGMAYVNDNKIRLSAFEL